MGLRILRRFAVTGSLVLLLAGTAPVTAARADSPEAAPDPSVLPDFGRYLDTWLWVESQGLVAASTPGTKGAARTLVMNPDLTYEFHQRRGTRDSLLCGGRFSVSEQSTIGGDPFDFLEFEGWVEPYERRMEASFDGPDTLTLLGEKCQNCPEHTFVRGRSAIFGGSVKRGEPFRRDLWDGLRLELDPIDLGWEIVLRDSARPRENLARLTPPSHSIPKPRSIEGWNLREAHPGPGAGIVNAPQATREFIFSREVGKTIPGAGADSAATEWEIERVGNQGRGVLAIEEMRLRPGVSSDRAGIESMRFTVAIEEVRGLPRGPRGAASQGGRPSGGADSRGTRPR
jgi:hypothetical protein